MLNSSAPICVLSDDAAFGPIVNDRCRDGFDFTIVFEQSVFVILPAALLLLVGPIRLRQLYRARVRVSSSSRRVAKLAVTSCLAVLQLSLAALWVTRGTPSSHVNMVSLAAACVSSLSSLMLCALSYAEHTKSPRPSSLLNAFLLASLFLDCALVRTVWLSDINTSIKGVVTTALGLKAISVLLEAMGKKKHLVDPSSSYTPEQTAGLYARAILAWVAPLLRTGFQRLLQPGDLFKLDEDMTAAILHENFARKWAHSFTSSKHRLVLCCITCLRGSLIAVIVPRVFLLAFTICQPLIVSSLLNFLNDLVIPARAGYGLIGAYGLVYLGIAFSQALYWHRNARSVSMLRGTLVTAVYSKLTELGIDVAGDAAAVTLMSTDVDVIVRAMKEIHEFWANILQIAIGTWLLSKQIGFAAVGPIIVCLVTLACTILTSPRAKMSRVGWLKKTQERVAITSAMIGQIKSIRMSGLSQTLSATISRLRLEEVAASRPFRVIGSITSSVAQIPIFISPVVAFAMFQSVAAHSGLTLDATRLFAALALITLQAQPLFFMFEVILDLSAASGAVDRIQKFLFQPGLCVPAESLEAQQVSSVQSIELQSLATRATSTGLTSSQGIKLEDASFSWSETKTDVSKVNLEVAPGQLAVITGPVAAGKSTLLKGILGEVPHATGRVQVAPGNKSWCQQSPWIMNGTIRDNVIGYSLFRQSLYDEIVHACALNEDFDQLPLGDLTRVGSKGFALSGGQKQRVAIARALYSQAEAAIFDDVFSGLDNATAKLVFANIFGRTGLFKKWNTTAVLATQSVGFISSADVVLVLNRDGTPQESGSFAEISKSGGYLQALQASFMETTAEGSSERHQPRRVEAAPKHGPTARPANQDKRRQLGDATVYKYYFGSIGVPFALTLLVLEVVWAFLQSFPSVWLKFWSDAESKSNDQVGYYLGIYAALQVIGVLWFAILIWFVLVRIAAKSGITLHQRLLDTVLKAPLSLFAKSDLGSTTTRFSQDIGMVDNQLPLALVVTLASFFTVFAKAGLLAASSYYVAISFPFLGVSYYFLQKGYLRTSRQLRFLDLEEKAPVYTQFLETLDGLSTIRAFGWSQAAVHKNHEMVDKSQKPFYLLIMVQRWLVLVLDLTTAVLALLVVGVSVHLRGSVSVSLTGVSLVQLISMSETLNMLIQFWTSIETSIGAVARIKQFAEDTGEETLPGEKGAPPANWPSQGHITISEISASYGEDDDSKALDGISMDIRPGEKVGICGRTGSGKSSLLLTLLRMLDYNKGSIAIDSIGLETLPRETIRSRLIAISQDQFILPGTVRENIDPFHLHQAETIIQALKDVDLWESIVSKGGLDAPMKDDMLSHGQKQLFFMGRAILRKDVGKIVLLDEATSSIDVETEQNVKRVIETRFQDHTVIAVAHRLETVMDFDRVVVLEQGKVVEVGKPRELLKSDGYFRSLWEASHGTSE